MVLTEKTGLNSLDPTIWTIVYKCPICRTVGQKGVMFLQIIDNIIN